MNAIKRVNLIYYSICPICSKKVGKSLKQHFNRFHKKNERPLIFLTKNKSKIPQIYFALLQNPGWTGYDLKLKKFGWSSSIDSQLNTMRKNRIVFFDEEETFHRKSYKCYPNVNLLVDYFFKYRRPNTRKDVQIMFKKFLTDKEFYPMLFSNKVLNLFNIDNERHSFHKAIDLISQIFYFFGGEIPTSYKSQDYDTIKKLSKIMHDEKIINNFEENVKKEFKEIYRSEIERYKNIVNTADEAMELLEENDFKKFLEKANKLP
jgi:hypothetical protein